MMFPAIAASPEKIFTPRRLLSESRPFLELPTPFLCAIFYTMDLVVRLCFLGDDVADEYFCQVLAVTVLFLVTLAAFFLEYDYLFASEVFEDFAFYFGS